MLPFNLLFRPGAVMRNHPVRDWRDITLWLKWGLFFSIGGVLLKAVLADNPASISYVFTWLEWLNEYHDTVSIPVPLQFALFFIIESLFVVLAWLIKSGMILLGYQLFDDIYFDETNIAFSLAGATMITNIWHILPYGTIFACIHSFVLIAYFTGQIHRLSPPQSLLLAVAGLVPLFY